MAMKIPCITSPLANSALGAKDGKDILVGNNPAEYAAHIIKLLENTAFADEIAEAGYHFVTGNYDWERATSKLEEMILKASKR
jgi:spore maturation protein CgeB